MKFMQFNPKLLGIKMTEASNYQTMADSTRLPSDRDDWLRKRDAKLKDVERYLKMCGVDPETGEVLE